jgi:hypothetical protein
VSYLLIFIGIIALNVVPFFTPATWTILAFIAATTKVNLLVLPVLAAVAATIGRTILARLSYVIVRSKFLSEKSKHNIDGFKLIIEKRRHLTMTGFLLYALGPLPTNYLFISYGLTTLQLRYLVVPFFIGRLLSYSFWIYIGYRFGTLLQAEGLTGVYDMYFIVTQIATIAAVYAFTRVNWRRIAERMR